MEAQGNSFEDSPSLPVNAGNKKYEIQIECTIDDSTTAGLTLFYNELANVWIAVNTDHFAVYNHQSRKISVKNEIGNHGYLRILNDENEVSFYYSTNRKDWVRVERTLYVAGFNHNVFVS